MPCSLGEWHEPKVYEGKNRMMFRRLLMATVLLALSACGGENTPYEDSDIVAVLIHPDPTGTWAAPDDPESTLTITSTTLSFAYQGDSDGEEPYAIEQGCPSAPQAPFDGPTFVTRPEGGDVFCYAIDTLEADRMVLIYLPRGNALEFVRAE